MNFIRNLFRKADRSMMYVVLLSCTGVGVFIYMNQWSYVHLTTTDWVMVYTMLGAALILDYFTFQIPRRVTSNRWIPLCIWPAYLCLAGHSASRCCCRFLSFY